MTKALRAGCTYFAGVFAVGFLLGVLRTLVLAPRIGETLAVLIELPIILGASWLICRRILRRAPPTHSAASTAFLGRSGRDGRCCLCAADDCGVVDVHPVGESDIHGASEVAHLLGLAGQIAFALFPVLQAMRRKPGRG